MRASREQIRARNAFTEAGQAKAADGAEEYLREARRLPAMLQINGLLAAWAFLKARGKEGAGGGDPKEGKAQRRLLAALRRHLAATEVGLPEGLVGRLDSVYRERLRRQEEELEKRGQYLTGGELRRLTAEAILYAGWLKRAAEAVCDTGQGGQA